MLMIAYGYSVKEQDDPLVKVVEAAMSGFSQSLKPGAFLVDAVPSREPRPSVLSLLGMLTVPVFFSISLAILTPSSCFILFYEQCDTSPTGSPRRDGKSRLSNSHRC